MNKLIEILFIIAFLTWISSAIVAALPNKGNPCDRNLSDISALELKACIMLGTVE